MPGKKIIIFGASGQDGSYLAKLLLSKGFKVYGTSRDAEVQKFSNLKILGIKERISVVSVAINDFGSVFQCIKNISPDVIYNLASQSSVALSFSQPHETMESIELGTLNILESIRLYGKEIKFYNACSSECFGDTGEKKADEKTPFNPLSPYAVSKAAAYWMVKNYREAYGIFACSGILFNHESPLRQDRFVTKKIINAAVDISKGKNKTLNLGNIDIVRDWGWAPDYVEAMWLMMENNISEDFVVATGISKSLKDFLSISFEYLNLNWKNYVSIDENLYRPTDISKNMGNPNKIKKQLGWKAKYSFHEMIKEIIEYSMAQN
ncbi:MAG: GDP-mannose 4,6-dehydratase [Candidatus Neomarinimicrobiota bacterium]